LGAALFGIELPADNFAAEQLIERVGTDCARLTANVGWALTAPMGELLPGFRARSAPFGHPMAQSK
jgi:hypothetical protein